MRPTNSKRQPDINPTRQPDTDPTRHRGSNCPQLSRIIGQIAVNVSFGCAWIANVSSAQSPMVSSQTSTTDHKPSIAFNIADAVEVRRFETVRQALQVQALKIVELHQDGRLKDDERVQRAANLLEILNVDREPSVRLLVQRMDDRRSGSVSEPDPLNGFEEAKALSRKLWPRTVEAIFDSLRVPLTREQLLIRTCVLGRLDDRRLTLQRLHLLKASLPPGADLAAAQCRANLSHVEAWLSNEEFFQDRSNWPSKLPGPAWPPRHNAPRAGDAQPPIQLLPVARLDIGDDQQIRQFGQLVKSARISAIRVLSNQARTRRHDHALAAGAANLLAGIHDPEATSLDPLLLNLSLREKLSGEPMGALDGFPAAIALAKTGNFRVRDRILEASLRGDRQGRQELLLRAHILYRIDRPEIILERISHFENRGDGAHYLANLRQIRDWFQTPGFFDDPANWSSRLPH